MSEKIISEIMDLVNGVITKSGAIPVLKATGRDAAAKWTADRLDEEYEAIRAKLREALERNPLTDEQIDSLWGGENVSVPQLVNRRAISRSIERAHGINS